MTDWRDQALCQHVDPDVFFPTVSDSYKVREAKRICNLCPVKAECLSWALEHDQGYDNTGVFGGLTARERQKLAPKRTHCARGHQLVGENVESSGRCRACHRMHNRKVS